MPALKKWPKTNPARGSNTFIYGPKKGAWLPLNWEEQKTKSALPSTNKPVPAFFKPFLPRVKYLLDKSRTSGTNFITDKREKVKLPDMLVGKFSS